jgi:hypothetical protein
VASTVDTGLPADASREILTLGQVEQHLWGAANILRGPIDQADFKSYIFPLLFFKRICDVYEEEFLDLSRFTREPSLLVFCTPFGFGTAVHRAFPGECRVLQGAFLSSEISSRWPYLEGLGPAQGSLRRQPGHPLESQVPERLARPLSERQGAEISEIFGVELPYRTSGLQLRQWAEVTIQVTSAAASAASSIDSSRPSANASANSASPSFSRAASSVCSRTSSPIA